MTNNPMKRLLAMVLCLCMVMSMYVPSVSATTVSYHDMSVAELLDLDEDLTWVFTGDSITHNGGWTGGYNDYAAWFEKYLYDIGRGDDTLINTAWGGAAIDHFLPTRSGSDGMGLEQFVTKYNPDVVFIKLGMNNRTMDDATFASKYNEMLDGIYAAGEANGKVPKVILLSPTPLSGEFGISSGEFGSDPTSENYYDSVKRFSVNLDAIAEQRGLEFVDLRQAMVDESAVLGDRYHYTFFSDPSDGLIHPNGAGQYFMFKTICKTLGLYDSAMPIFQVSYDDIVNAPLYGDNTNVSYTGEYGVDHTASANAAEMDKTMPQLPEVEKVPVLLASADLTSSNGKFGGDAGEVRYLDLMGDVMTDKLTGDEVKSMGKEYSVVFRAKLENVDFDFKNHGVALYMSTDNTQGWNNNRSLMVGFPGKHATNGYYTKLTGATGTKFGDARTAAMDGQWHTFAVVQKEGSLRIYVDGTEYTVKDGSGKELGLNANIGEFFAAAVDAGKYEANFGSYGGVVADAGYGMDGWVDYVQLYDGALNAEEIAILTENGGIQTTNATEMNKTMPTLTDLAPMASVDFTGENGALDFGSSDGLRIDTATEGYAIDTLTQAEAATLETAFSVVFRAKLNSTYQNNQPVLFISSNGTDNWKNALVVGAPAKTNQLYFNFNNGGAVLKCGTINATGTTVNGDDQFHTLVITYNAGTITYYVDGAQIGQFTGYGLKEGYTSIGGLFENSENFAVQIGRYGTLADGTSYKLKGDFDFWQFYNSALDATQIQSLSAVVSDADQMNATMPQLPVQDEAPELLASVDFSSKNGHFAGTSAYATSTRWDLTDASKMTDALTLEEFQALDREFSIVLRAKLDSTTNKNHQPLLMVSSNGVAQWDDAISIGGPGTDNAFYYEVRKGNTENIAADNTVFLNKLATPTPKVTDEWHTIAIVQRTDGLDYYVDGVLAQRLSHKLKDGVTFGGLFADAADFAAHIGSFAENDATSYNLKADLDFYQIYGGALTADMVKVLSGTTADATVEAAEWTESVQANYLWAVVGADQMSGYLGETPNFSLFRLLNNGMRGGANEGGSYRDIRMMNLAKPGQTVSDVVANYDEILGEHQSRYNVLMLLPEVPDVFAADYVHSADKVAAYKANVETLIAKNADKAIVLWTPLATNDAAVNAYINDYAAAVRQIASADATVLFFDANKFMNERLATVGSNWFDDSMHISPLCATDLAYAFYVNANYPLYNSTKDPTNKGELLNHNLRMSSDKRLYKSGVIKENLSYGVTVNGGSFTVDASAIAALGYTNLRVASIPALGIGSVVEPWILGNAGQSLEAPHSNPCITVYGEKDGVTYRFQDVQLTLTTSNNYTEPYFETDDLTALEVVGAPAIGFDPSKTTYDVELYQYQRQVRIVAEGGNNLTIKVNGVAVEAGEFSQYIAVEDTATVTVTVTGGAADKTYTLNLTKPDYADIIITEVMTDGYDGYTKKGADNYELIEIYNASGEDLNLLDYSIGYIREYPYANDIVEDGEIPYYFTGNDHNFFGNSYLGINQITKYSSYWADKVDQEPEEVIFPADSTMVIWVKFSKDSGTEYGSTLTYETLIGALEAHSGTHTLTVEVEENGQTVTKTIVPNQDQLVVAEIPYGAAQSNVTQNITTSATNFYMDSFQAQQDYNNRRGWLFVLDDSAVRDYYGALTEAGDDIISAAKFVRPGATQKLSSVMYYDVERGMSVVKNPSYWDTALSTGHTSDQQGYANKTSFGAIEYWQKPFDFGDSTAALIKNNTPATVEIGSDATIALAITDNQDIRYIELYVDADNDGTYETVIKKDITLITSATNAGKATDVKSYELTYALTGLENTVNYYGYVLDGNNNKTQLGSAEAPVTITTKEKCEHSYTSEQTKAPTCTEAGEMTYTCSECGDTYTEAIAPAGEHNYDDGVQTKAPTCTEDGEMTYTCTACGHSYTEVIDATGHTGEVICTTCGEVLAEAGETVALTGDVSVAELVIPAEVTLDLNGHTLTVESLVSFGDIIDTTGNGLLVVTEFELTENSYLPIFDSVAGGYRFFAYQLKNLGVRAAGTKATFGFMMQFENAAAYELLANSDDADISITMTLAWGENARKFEFSSELIRQYAALQVKYPALRAAMMLSVTGLDVLESGTVLSVTPAMSAADDQIVATNEAMTYTR